VADPVAVQGWLEVDRLTSENRDLRRRIDRTLGYIEELAAGPLDSTTRLVADAVKRSLITPAKPDEGLA
jgi:hypothetical protein